jgi:type VI secretion system protein ImpF
MADLLPSILDRLMDDKPAEARDGARRFGVAQLKAVVARDLENLLNTRTEAVRIIPDAYPESQKSVAAYGLPDFMSYSLASPHDRDRIRRQLEQAIALHESRLTRVRVLIDQQKEHERMLRFRVDALLEMPPDREKVQFDAVLQLNTQTYQVRG